MKISRKNLKLIIESLLAEGKRGKHDKTYVCPNCGHKHDSKKDIRKLFRKNKCVNCGTSFDAPGWKPAKPKISEQVTPDSCPIATQNKRVNRQNKLKAASDPQIKYGHPDRRRILRPLAEQGKLCGNCAAFDVSEQMQQCGGANVEETRGYCKMHDFTCAAQKTCLTWAPGGPKRQ
jgi:predicted RNA-binding Zn-ribbon protein involved in translation (DUF1610 family)